MLLRSLSLLPVQQLLLLLWLLLQLNPSAPGGRDRPLKRRCCLCAVDGLLQDEGHQEMCPRKRGDDRPGSHGMGCIYTPNLNGTLPRQSNYIAAKAWKRGHFRLLKSKYVSKKRGGGQAAAGLLLKLIAYLVAAAAAASAAAAAASAAAGVHTAYIARPPGGRCYWPQRSHDRRCCCETNLGDARPLQNLQGHTTLPLPLPLVLLLLPWLQLKQWVFQEEVSLLRCHCALQPRTLMLLE